MKFLFIFMSLFIKIIIRSHYFKTRFSRFSHEVLFPKILLLYASQFGLIHMNKCPTKDVFNSLIKVLL